MPARENSCGVDEIVRPFDDLYGMVKKYVAFRLRSPGGAADIARGFILGLAEFGSFGTKLYDLTGYPHGDESEAIYSDWQMVGSDLENVIRDVDRKATGPKAPSRQGGPDRS